MRKRKSCSLRVPFRLANLPATLGTSAQFPATNGPVTHTATLPLPAPQRFVQQKGRTFYLFSLPLAPVPGVPLELPAPRPHLRPPVPPGRPAHSGRPQTGFPGSVPRTLPADARHNPFFPLARKYRPTPTPIPPRVLLTPSLPLRPVRPASESKLHMLPLTWAPWPSRVARVVPKSRVVVFTATERPAGWHRAHGCCSPYRASWEERPRRSR